MRVRGREEPFHSGRRGRARARPLLSTAELAGPLARKELEDTMCAWPGGVLVVEGLIMLPGG